MKKIMMMVAVAVLVSGCAGMKQEMARRQMLIDQSTPYCQGEEECKQKWAAAQVWVSQNIRYRVQMATDSIIQTMGPSRYPDQTLTAATVTKEPIGGGKYKITSKMSCYSMIVCAPDPFQATLAMNDYINAVK
jgi:uncharacterized protein YceK